jgi:hypothetical protein
MSPRTALRFAWRIWLVLLVIPFLVFLAAVVAVPLYAQDPGPVTQPWFIAAIVYTGLAVPGAFFIRERLFRDYWQGRTVAPRRYLAGMLVIWLTIESAGLISLAGSFASGSLFPNLLPAVFAFVSYLAFWPTGSAMTTPVGDVDDSSVFLHPR